MAPDPRTRPDNLAEIDRLARTLAKDPGSKAFMPLAEEYGKAGMWQEAVSVLETGLKAYPGFVTAMVALGRAYDQVNQPVKAKAVLEEAVKASPENLRAHRTLAKIYTGQGAIDAARKSCEVVLSANPVDQEALALRAALDAATASAAPAAPPSPSASALDEQDHSLAEMVASEPSGSANLGAHFESNRGDAESSEQQVEQPRMSPAHSIVERLEGWLASIRTRRRDRAEPGESEKPTL